jgi:hypothetical protein
MTYMHTSFVPRLPASSASCLPPAGASGSCLDPASPPLPPPGPNTHTHTQHDVHAHKHATRTHETHTCAPPGHSLTSTHSSLLRARTRYLAREREKTHSLAHIEYHIMLAHMHEPSLMASVSTHSQTLARDMRTIQSSTFSQLSSCARVST